MILKKIWSVGDACHPPPPHTHSETITKTKDCSQMITFWLKLNLLTKLFLHVVELKRNPFVIFYIVVFYPYCR